MEDQQLLIERLKFYTSEYQYRDILMAREFYFSTAVVGVVLTIIISQFTLEIVVLGTAFGTVALWVLNGHMRRVNEDRLLALDEVQSSLKSLENIGTPNAATSVKWPIPHAGIRGIREDVGAFGKTLGVPASMVKSTQIMFRLLLLGSILSSGMLLFSWLEKTCVFQ